MQLGKRGAASWIFLVALVIVATGTWQVWVAHLAHLSTAAQAHFGVGPRYLSLQLPAAPTCRMPRSAKVKSGNGEHGSRVDLVVSFFCEDVRWLERLNPSLQSIVAVWVVDKSENPCPKETGLDDFVASGAFPVTVLRMSNVGRDGHSTIAFIRNYYAELAEYTVFVQAGHHLYVSAQNSSLYQGWDDQASLVNDAIMGTLALGTPLFVPLVRRTKKGPVLAVDAPGPRDPYLEKVDENNLYHFRAGSADEYNRGRELYSIMFGGTPCDAPHPAWTPGMQYMIHKKALLARPCEVWEGVEHLLAGCLEFIWALERVTTYLFNASLVVRPTVEWQAPSFCPTSELHTMIFQDPPDEYLYAKFWRQAWKCEPLSRALLAAAPAPPTRTLWVQLMGGLGNQFFQLSSLLAVGRAANKTQALLGRIRLAVPSQERTPDGRPTYFANVASWFAPLRQSQSSLNTFIECTMDEQVYTGDPFNRRWLLGKEPAETLAGEDWAEVLATELSKTQRPIWLIRKADGCETFKLGGFFQDRRYYGSALDDLRSVFWHEPSVRKAEKQLGKLVPRESAGEAVAIHFRLTDTKGGWEVADEYYPLATALIGDRIGRPLVCVIFSDEVEEARKRVPPGCEQSYMVPPETDEVTSFYMMALLPHSVVATSSFSFWAALLGKKTHVTVPNVKYTLFDYVKQHGWMQIKTRIKACQRDC